MTEKKTVTITLDEPVTFQDETYSELTFRKMKAKDLVASDGVTGEMRKSMAIFASMAGVPLPVIEDLDGDDFIKVGLEVAPLMGKSGKVAAAEAKAALAGEEPTTH